MSSSTDNYKKKSIEKVRDIPVWIVNKLKTINQNADKAISYFLSYKDIIKLPKSAPKSFDKTLETQDVKYTIYKKGVFYQISHILARFKTFFTTPSMEKEDSVIQVNVKAIEKLVLMFP